MSEPFLAEVRIVGFNFPPRGWAFADGQTLPINQNQSLYSLIGNTYGGDGRTSFALPDLRGRTPVHFGDNYSLGHRGGAETVTLTAAEMPPHTHAVNVVSTAGNTREPGAHYLAAADATPAYRDPSAASDTTLRSGTVANAGGGQAHDNMQPYITLAFCIALQGVFPSRN